MAIDLDVAVPLEAAPELAGMEDVRLLPGGFPEPSTLGEITQKEAQGLAEKLTTRVEKLLSGDKDAFETLYYENGFWRDQVSLSWTFRTFHTKATIIDRIPPLIARAGIKDVTLDPRQVEVLPLPNGITLLRLGFTYKTSTPETKSTAAFKFLKLANGEVKLFTTTTALQELDVAPWGECKRTSPVSEELPSRTDAIIVGAGHAGLALGSYLQALGLDFIIVDREEQVGDAWAKRYDSATLHTSRVFSGLPYKPFPRDYPEFVPGKLIAQYYKDYVRELELPVYQRCEVEQADYNEQKKEWTVRTARGTVVARQLIFAIGIGGRFPVKPDFPGSETFEGLQLHSAQYTNPTPWLGKKVVIVGASTTGLDVGWDCSRMGIDVTVVQRGPVRIYAPEHTYRAQQFFWNDHRPAALGDIMATEDPVVLNATLSSLVLGQLKEAHDPAYYSGLKKAGFLATVDGAVHNQIFCRSGKHYPDIGAGQAIIDGDIKIKSGSLISHITPTGVAFEDGTSIDADVICYCTGFRKDNRDVISSIIGDKIKLEAVWNIDAEGEIRGVFRPTGHDATWIMGGELQTMRYYGRFLSSQIAAAIKGVRPEPVRT